MNAILENLNVVAIATDIRNKLKKELDSETNPIDTILPIIPPYIGKGPIKLIIIGQDPTVRNAKGRKNINTTLNLDKPNSLQSYISFICKELEISVENVYATNLFKYFYTLPPSDTLEVLNAHIQPNLELLQQELSLLGNIPIITLGEPVLKLLTNDKIKVRDFWGYHANGISTENFFYSIASINKLGMNFFPFPHQPSISKQFYANTLKSYLEYMKYVIRIMYQIES